MPGVAGNQSPDPLIDFYSGHGYFADGWESVTRPLDRLQEIQTGIVKALGISHQTP